MWFRSSHLQLESKNTITVLLKLLEIVIIHTNDPKEIRRLGFIKAQLSKKIESKPKTIKLNLAVISQKHDQSI